MNKARRLATSNNDGLGTPMVLYIIFLVSFFLHIPARLPILGAIRMDMLLVAGIGFLVYQQRSRSAKVQDQDTNRTMKWLLAILWLAVLSLPLVKWPGTVLGKGLEGFIKAAIFFFFTVWLVDSERKLQAVVFTFVACNVLRVIEPLYMHLTTGYWGSQTWLGDGEMANRLSGAPSDVVNSNGLAFVIASVIPFLHYVFGINGWKRLAYFCLLGALLYTMILTLSRTGFLALLIIGAGIFWKSQRKGILAVIMLAIGIGYFASLDDVTRERYLSITRDDVRGSETSKGRVEFTQKSFEAALPRIVLGHGLGTSREVNFHSFGNAQPAHNLYVEILQEIGAVGLIFFLLFLREVIRNFFKARSYMATVGLGDCYLSRLTDALQVWMIMNILFSFASYGLSSYEWYLFGGLSVVVLRLAVAQSGHAPTLPPGRQSLRRK